MIAQSIIVPAVFAAVMYSVRFSRVFEEVVSDVIFGIHGDKHLKDRGDLGSIWSRVTKAICKDRFEELSEDIEKSVLSKHLPIDKNFFYCNYYRRLAIELVRRKPSKIVKIVEDLRYTIIPVSKETTVKHDLIFKDGDGIPHEFSGIKVRSLIINNKTFEPSVISQEIGDDKKTHRYEVNLKGEESYHIQRVMELHLNIDEDPVIKYSPDEFIKGSEIEVSVIGNGIKPFVSANWKNFYEDTEENESTPDLLGMYAARISTRRLLFPDQGYTLFIR